MDDVLRRAIAKTVARLSSEHQDGARRALELSWASNGEYLEVETGGLHYWANWRKIGGGDLWACNVRVIEKQPQVLESASGIYNPRDE